MGFYTKLSSVIMHIQLKIFKPTYSFKEVFYKIVYLLIIIENIYKWYISFINLQDIFSSLILHKKASI